VGFGVKPVAAEGDPVEEVSVDPDRAAPVRVRVDDRVVVVGGIALGEAAKAVRGAHFVRVQQVETNHAASFTRRKQAVYQRHAAGPAYGTDPGTVVAAAVIPDVLDGSQEHIVTSLATAAPHFPSRLIARQAPELSSGHR